MADRIQHAPRSGFCCVNEKQEDWQDNKMIKIEKKDPTIVFRLSRRNTRASQFPAIRRKLMDLFANTRIVLILIILLSCQFSLIGP